MYFSKFLNIVRSYLWLLVLATVIAGLTTFFMFRNQPNIYEARTQLLVGPSLDSASPDLNSLKIGGQLIQTYAELVNTRPFLESINSKLSLKMDLDKLGNMIETKQNIDTRILTIIVHNQDREQAVAIANAAAQSLIEISPAQDNTTTLLRAQMSRQSHALENIITSAETSIQELEKQLVTLGGVRTATPEEAQALLEEKNLIIQQLGEARARLSDALRTQATIYQVLLDTNTNQVAIIEPADAVIPINQNIPLRASAGAIAGLVFALIIILGIEYFDNTIRVPDELSDFTNAPVLSVIERHHDLSESGLAGVVTSAHPHSGAANNYRTAVSKLLFSIKDSVPFSLLLSGSGSASADNADVVAVNLAVAFAQAGKQVVLVDAQFQNPVLTKLFEASDKAGLSDLLLNNSTKLSLMPVKELPGVRFLPVGLAAEKGAGTLLDTERTTNLLSDIQQEADLVLIATSPISSYAESLSLASHVQGVVLVTRPGITRSKTLQDVAVSLASMNIPLMGTIFDQNPSPFVSNRNVVLKTWQNIKTLSRGKRAKVAEETIKS